MEWRDHCEVWNGEMIFMGGKARLEKNRHRPSEKCPSHRVVDAWGYEIGAFWPAKGGEGGLSGRIGGYKAMIVWKTCAFYHEYGVLMIDPASRPDKEHPTGRAYICLLRDEKPKTS